MMELKKEIQQLAQQYFDDTVAIRRHMHQYPELSFEEFETSDFIQKQLDKIGVSYRTGIVKTGIIARLDGKLPGGRTIALRADMDALPIVENSDKSYCSLNRGVMHACGHDAHSASLLGVIRILKKLEHKLRGTFLFIFQPGEEQFPGGGKLLLESRALNDPKPELILAQHVLPEMEAGHVGFRPGMYMASGDEIFFTVKGKGGHGALPHKLTDTVLTTAHIITALQQVVSRNAPADVPSVLSFGRVIAEGATNIIPDEVNVSGTFRTMDETWRAEAKERIRKIGQAIAEGMGATCEFHINHGYPMLMNNHEVTKMAREFAVEYLGKEKVEDMGLRMTCEDFAYYSQQFPVAFFRFGVKKPGTTETASLHSPTFDIDEKALETSVGHMAYLAVRFSQQEKE